MNPRPVRNLVGSAIVLLCMLSLEERAACAGSAGARDGMAGGTIYFSSNRPENWDLFLFERAGAPPRALTTHPALDYDATFSPDGRWVVFTSERDGSPDLWAIDLHAPSNGGTDMPAVQLTHGPTMEAAAAFSPDGKTLAFAGTRDGRTDVYVMPFRPGDLTAYGSATNLTRGHGGNFRPAFSNDGSHIAFSSDRNRSGLHQLYVMRADGTGARKLTADPLMLDGSPAWSQDGTSLFVHRTRAVEGQTTMNQAPLRHELDAAWLMEVPLSGSPPRAVTTEGLVLSPAPAGRDRLVANRRTKEGWRIISIGLDGRDERLEGDSTRDWFDPAVNGRTGAIVAHGRGAQPDAPTLERTRRPMVATEAIAARTLADREVRLFPVRGVSPAAAPAGGPLLATTMGPAVYAYEPGAPALRKIDVPAGGMPVWVVRWAPDGKWFVHTAGPPFAPAGAPVDIWRTNADGSGAANLTASSPGNDGFPDISFDGRWIVFRSGRDGNHEIYLMNADGSNPRRLTHHEATDTMPAFGPRADRVAFASTRDGSHQLYELALQADGSPGEVKRLTTGTGTDVHPYYSPDGQWIVFASARGGLTEELMVSRTVSPNPQPEGELWALRLADGHVQRLTHDRWEDGLPIWIPDRR